MVTPKLGVYKGDAGLLIKLTGPGVLFMIPDCQRPDFGKIPFPTSRKCGIRFRSGRHFPDLLTSLPEERVKQSGAVT